MRESFRSTKPITELAVNVLNRLSDEEARKDHKELVNLGLIESTTRAGETWLNVRYNQIKGPSPIFRTLDKRQDEFARIFKDIKYLIQEESVRPTDICIIYNGKQLCQDLQAALTPKFAKMGIELSLQKNRSFERNQNTLVMTTSHSYKGYESEVVIIPGVDQFVTGQGQILANTLYVAMTRARSLLALYGTRDGRSTTNSIFDSLNSCLRLLNETPRVETETSKQDNFHDLLELIGTEHRQWLKQLWTKFELKQEPILGDDGRVVFQPLFWFDHNGARMACTQENMDVPAISNIRFFNVGQSLQGKEA